MTETVRASERRRIEWLAEHPCACGNPSVAVVAGPGSPSPNKGVWAWADETRRQTELASTVTLCPACRAVWQRERLAGIRPAAPNPRGSHLSLSAVEPVADISPTVARTHKASKPDGSGFADEMDEKERRRQLAEWRDERRERMGYG